MTDADKNYMTYDTPEDEHDPWEFIGQQVKGILAFAAIVVGVWMLVAAVVVK